MTTYDLMIKTNHYLIKGGKLTETQKNSIVNQFILEISNTYQRQKYYNGVKSPNNTDSKGRRMYPEFFIPPYNDGKKYKTVLNQTPKTQILSSNVYELEILRLLFLLAPENETVIDMVNTTLKRLKTTCFGNEDDGVGECFDASLIVLRFLCTVTPSDTTWIISRVNNYNDHVNEKKRPWFSLWYYWLCLSEMPFHLAENEILKYKSEMLDWLTNKSCVMNSDTDKTIHPVLLSILRNTISRFPTYEYIKDREPYINDKDGRLHFDMQP